MKNINGKENYYTKKYIILFVFISILIKVFCDTIKIGELPYIKKLNSNRYIMISSEGIAFLDPTFTYSSDITNFLDKDEYITENYDNAISTQVVQFPPEDGDLIFVMIYEQLYIFDSNETLLNYTCIVSYGNKPYYLIPYEHNENNFIISLIHVDENRFENCVVLYTKDIIYNLDSNIIYLSEEKPTNLEEVLSSEIGYGDKVESIACCLIF